MNNRITKEQPMLGPSIPAMPKKKDLLLLLYLLLCQISSGISSAALNLNLQPPGLPLEEGMEVMLHRTLIHP